MWCSVRRLAQVLVVRRLRVELNVIDVGVLVAVEDGGNPRESVAEPQTVKEMQLRTKRQALSICP